MTPKILLRRLVVLGVVSGALVVLVPGLAAAHPLGNFTVNRYSGLVVAVDSVQVDHVLDLAEIPTAQRMQAIDTDRDEVPSPSELATYARQECSDAAEALRLTVAGAPVRLRVDSATARIVAGQAGLPTLRVQCGLSASTTKTSGEVTVSLVDTVAGDEIGWREMTAAGDGTSLVAHDVAVRSASRRLTRYPSDLLSSPLDVQAAHVRVRPGGPVLAAPGLDVADASLPRRLTGGFESLVTRYEGGPLIVLSSLLAALALGAAHAVAPGHGKTVMAFYLSGRQQGAVRAAGTVAATVTVTHTAGVLLLGVLVSAGTGFVPARLYPWLTVVGGLLVATVALSLLGSARHPHGHAHPHAHPHPHHDAPVDQAAVPTLVGAAAGTPARSGTLGDRAAPEHSHHDGNHSHDAVRDDVHDTDRSTASRSALVAMGMAGGLVPSPSAVLVFLAAVTVGHAWFGVLLVVAFGLGMAVALALSGLVVLRLRTTVESRFAGRTGSLAARVVQALPLLTACAVLLLGLAMAAKGLSGLSG